MYKYNINIPKESKEGIVNDYKNGIRVKDIEKKYSVSNATVYRVLDVYNIPKRTNRNNYKKYINDIIKDYNDGVSLDIITSTYNISYSTIHKIISKKTNSNIIRRRKQLCDRDKNKVIIEYLAGTPVNDICNKYGYTATTVYNILRENNIKRQRKRACTKEVIDNIINDYNKCMSYRNIAKKYGVSETTVRYHINKYIRNRFTKRI